MAPREPKFLLKLQNRMNGISDEEEDDEELEYVGSGRPPIPKRPAIPERPEDNPGSADEDDEDEKPQVVILKAGKHLTEREAENVRRKEKGLPPLSEPKVDDATVDNASQSSSKESASKSKTGSQGLSFSSSSKSNPKSNNKRKAIGQLDELKDGVMKTNSDDKAKSKNSQKGSTSLKKAKQSNKTLLSFGDDT